MRKRPTTAGIALLAFLCLGCVTDTLAQTETTERTARLRQSLEAQFRASTGLGFARFQCAFPPGEKPAGELTCQAVDEEGDRFSYRIIFHGEDQAPTVTTSQPVDQLGAEGRELIERPCKAFLNAFERAAWPEAYANFSEGFRSEVTLEALESMLIPIRQMLGRVTSFEATSYTSPSPGQHILEYDLDTEGGAAVARFRLQFAGDQPRIFAFLVTAQPGSALQARLLTASGRETLQPLFGQPVEQIDAPLASLEQIGDAVEGVAVLADGTNIEIRVEQRNTAHDLDGNDYRFQVLDVAWLIRRYLESTGTPPEAVECPSRTAPDGGSVECAATLQDGTRKTIRIARRGGDHRLLQ
jgi:hypothetical protein